MKILIVDDEQDIRESVQMLVETQGYETRVVDNGLSAINALKKEKFDLVLLDVLMPNLSGIKTLKKIRTDPKLKNQKVVFLTVVSPSKNGKRIIEELKPTAYIEKPIDNASFKKKLKEILGK